MHKFSAYIHSYGLVSSAVPSPGAVESAKFWLGAGAGPR
jgi:hypothetical protein